MSLETSISATFLRSAYWNARRAKFELSSPPTAPSTTLMSLSAAYTTASANRFVSTTNVSHTRIGTNWQLGQMLASRSPLFVSPAADFARSEPWPDALQQLEASNGSLSSSKKSQP